MNTALLDRPDRPETPVNDTPARVARLERLLGDPAFDALLTGESTFDELPEVMGKLAGGSLPAVCHTIGYEGAS